MRSLSNELSRRARMLLSRDGHEANVGGVRLGRDLVLPELYLTVDEKGTLTVETNDLPTAMLYMESPNGAIISSSPNEALEWAVCYLSKHMVLEDMAEV